MPSRILVVGSGGREHALAWRLARDPGAREVFVAPGNDACERVARRLDVRESDVAGLLAAVRSHAIELVVIGPEGPLAGGVADALRAAGVPTFGPSAAAARLESSQWFAKEVMREAGVPTARARAIERTEDVPAALAEFRAPWVVKADGLAAGKGVLVTRDRAEAGRFACECLAGVRFGAGGARVLCEEYLAGEEASVMAVCDGERHLLLPAARDYKRAYDGDAGPNTGGMGGFAPVPAVDETIERVVGERVVAPVLRTMAARGMPFRGLLYCGLMLGDSGARVVEFNVRFGDPETQSVLPLLGGDLAALLASAAAGTLVPSLVTRLPGVAVTVALVDEGYPADRREGGEIAGLDDVESESLHVFHAGTRRAGTGWQVTGGRAAYLTATAATLDAARERAYAARAALAGRGWRCRNDIAAGVHAVSGEGRNT